MNSFSATIITAGDHFVGLQPINIEVTFKGFATVEQWCIPRNELRQDLKDLFGPMLDCPVGVVFSDECHDCGQVKPKGERCRSRHCLATESPTADPFEQF